MAIKCPFCGSEDHVLRFHEVDNYFPFCGWYYLCRGCGARGPIVNSKLGAGEAFAKRFFE